jgi:hypothetical protein
VRRRCSPQSHWLLHRAPQRSLSCQLYSGFGSAVAIRNGIAFVGIPSGVPDSRVAIYGQTASGWVRNGTLTFTYRRDGSTVSARGVTSGYVRSDSIGLANNWLVVGASDDPNGLCQSELSFCLGEASVFDLNRFEEQAP